MSPPSPLPARRGTVRWLAVVLLLAATPAAGTAQEPVTIRQNGSELFRAILHSAKIKPLTLREYNAQGPDETTILVIMGRTRKDATQVPWEFLAGQHLKAGGAVLYASDTDSELGPQLPGDHGLRIHQDRVWTDDPNERHSNNPNSPFLVALSPRFPDRGPMWDIFRGLRRVVTEHPSCLEVDRYSGVVEQPLALFPRGAYFSENERVRPDPNRNPFAVAGAGPGHTVRSPYRFLALADQAVFLNRLIADPTTENLELARRVVTFLQDPGGVNRTKCLFVEYGRVVEDFETAYRVAVPQQPLPPFGLPPWEKVQQMIVDGGNRLIDKAEENDVLNTMALGPESNPNRRQRNLVRLLQGLLVVGSVWAVVFVLRRVWRARQPSDQPRPPTISGAPKPGPAGIFNRREQELLRRNNLYEPVRDLLRDFFIAAGAPPTAGRKLSHLVFESSGSKTARLRKAIDELWRIAYGRPVLVTVYQWQELEPKFEMVRLAFEDGVWRFEAAATATGRGKG